jgi:hypothetical protein
MGGEKSYLIERLLGGGVEYFVSTESVESFCFVLGQRRLHDIPPSEDRASFDPSSPDRMAS